MIGKIYNIDAWASPEGWTYNQIYLIGACVLPDNCKDEDVVEALYEGEFIKTKEGIEVETYFNGDDWGVELKDAKTGEPLYEVDFIRKVEN